MKRLKAGIVLTLFLTNQVLGTIRALILTIPIACYTYISGQYRRDTEEELRLRFTDMYLMAYYAGLIGMAFLILDSRWLGGKWACRTANRCISVASGKDNK